MLRQRFGTPLAHAGTLPPGVIALATPRSGLVAKKFFFVALGVPLGTPEFVEAHLRAALARPGGLLDNLPALHSPSMTPK